MEEKVKKVIRWIAWILITIVSVRLIVSWHQNHSVSESSQNSPSVAHQQPKYQSFDFKIKGEGTATEGSEDLYIGTITEDRVLVTLDCAADGEMSVTTFDFNPKTKKGTWVTIITDPNKPFYNQKTKIDGTITAIRTSTRFPIFQLTLYYKGKERAYGALVPVSTGS